jgi:hypothetical protein
MINMINMIKKLSAPVSLLLAIALFVPGLSQTRDQKGQEQTTAKKTRAVNESCDGALNIVPTKSMSFARKRRPAHSETKTESKPESKTKNKTKTEPKPAERQTGDGR